MIITDIIIVNEIIDMIDDCFTPKKILQELQMEGYKQLNLTSIQETINHYDLIPQEEPFNENKIVQMYQIFSGIDMNLVCIKYNTHQHIIQNLLAKHNLLPKLPYENIPSDNTKEDVYMYCKMIWKEKRNKLIENGNLSRYRKILIKNDYQDIAKYFQLRWQIVRDIWENQA